ncbi:MAG TPA: fumarylacetoacetate hydrolase family protein, partial [Cytophagaceae bacterium]
AIGRNYADHIKELQNEVPIDPVIFLKPDTALLKNNAPFYYPSFSQNIHYEVELVIRINKEGKNIKENFASKYFDRIGLGIDFTARDIQDNLKSKGLPWTLAKGFNGSAPVSEFIMANEFTDLNAINFSLSVNGVEKQKGFSGNMINSFSQIISFISKYITLKNGDIIFTGTPAGVGPVQIGDKLEGYIDGRKMLDFDVK